MRIGDQVIYVGHEQDGIKGAVGVLESQDLPGIWNVKLASGQIVICKTTELEYAGEPPAKVRIDRPFRRGDHCVLIEDHRNLDGSIVIQPKGTVGLILRRFDSIARVQFDGAAREEVVFTHKLAYLPKSKVVGRIPR